MRVLARMEEVGRPGRRGLPAHAWPSDLAEEARQLETEIQELAGEPFLVNSTQAAAGDPLRQARAGAAEADQDRLLHRRPVPREAAGPAPHHRIPAPVPGGREAALDLRRHRCWPRWRRTAGSTPRSTRRWPGPGGCQSDQPNLHNIPIRSEEGKALPAGVHPRRRVPLPGGRLQPDRAPGHRPPGRGSGAHRGLPGRDGHPHRDRGPDLRGRRCRGHHGRHALQGQDGVLRAGLRDGVLRSGPAAGHPGRRGGRRSSRRTSRRSPTSGPTWTGWSPRPASRGLHRDAVRPAPPDPRAAVRPLPDPPGRRAPGHERRHPGPRRRHLQDGPGPPRPPPGRTKPWTAG